MDKESIVTNSITGKNINEFNNYEFINIESSEDFIKLMAYSMFYGNKEAVKLHKKETAFRKIPFIDKGLKELPEFIETSNSNRGGYPLTDYLFDSDIGICINGSRLITNHIRIVEVSFNSFKLKVFKDFEKRKHTPFKLEDIETFNVFKVNTTKQTVLGGYGV
jgi:hypothetical protein